MIPQQAMSVQSSPPETLWEAQKQMTMPTWRAYCRICNKHLGLVRWSQQNPDSRPRFAKYGRTSSTGATRWMMGSDAGWPAQWYTIKCPGCKRLVNVSPPQLERAVRYVHGDSVLL